MKVAVKNPETFKKLFNTDVENAKYTAENLAELFARLMTLGDACIGMRVSLGGASFVVVKEEDTFFLIDEPKH